MPLNQFKKEFQPFRFLTGRTGIRFLPQPVHAAHDWYIPLPYLALSQEGKFRYVYMSKDQAGMVAEIVNGLYAHPELSKRMAKRENPDGVLIKTRYRNGFLGFNCDKRSPTSHERVPDGLTFYLLPASPYGTHRKAVGTEIINYPTSVNPATGLPLGSIVDLDTGRSVYVDVTTSSSHPFPEYHVHIGDQLSLHYAMYEPVLRQIVPFENIIEYNGDDEFREVLGTYLPEDIAEYATHVMDAQTAKNAAPVEPIATLDF